jgi:hypothetical protein
LNVQTTVDSHERRVYALAGKRRACIDAADTLRDLLQRLVNAHIQPSPMQPTGVSGSFAPPSVQNVNRYLLQLMHMKQLYRLRKMMHETQGDLAYLTSE